MARWHLLPRGWRMVGADTRARRADDNRARSICSWIPRPETSVQSNSPRAMQATVHCCPTFWLRSRTLRISRASPRMGPKIHAAIWRNETLRATQRLGRGAVEAVVRLPCPKSHRGPDEPPQAARRSDRLTRSRSSGGRSPHRYRDHEPLLGH